jgi:phospholipid transport system substrate-binding protein
MQRLMRRDLMRRRIVVGLGALLPLSLSGTRKSARAQTASGPLTPIQILDDGLLAAMRAGRATPFDTRMQMLIPIVQRAFNLPAILQASVGPRYVSFSPQTQADLLNIFIQFTAASYAANFDSYNGERFEVSPETRRSGSDEVVTTKIVGSGGESNRLDYVVRANGGAYQIVDVLLDGSISRVAVQRSDFRSVLASGDATPLIGMLRNKVASLAAGNKG